MAAPRCVKSPWNTFKRLKVQPFAAFPLRDASFSTSAARLGPQSVEESSDAPPPRPQMNVLRPQDQIRNDLVNLAHARQIPLPTQLQASTPDLRQPRSVQLLYLRPLHRTPTHGIPVANLQLRSFNVRSVEFVADFAMRAAYYLNLPAKGPIPLPRITQRWTVPRANFIFKKSQENFERVTVRRLVQVLDGHPEVVQRWLAFVRKWSWYGVGMKADVFEFEGLEVSKRMDEAGDAVASGIEGVRWEFFGRRKGLSGEEAIGEQLQKQGFETGGPGLPAP